MTETSGCSLYARLVLLAISASLPFALLAEGKPKDPVIARDGCQVIEGLVGPEDLVRIPGRKAVLVSSAKRNLLTRKPQGQVVRVGLEGCQAEALKEDCAGDPETIYESPWRLSPVGMALKSDSGGPGHKLFMVESGRRCRVLELALDADGTRVGEPKPLGRCREPGGYGLPGLTPRLNGIGISSQGDVLVTNATKRPGIGFKPAEGSGWISVDKPNFRFANGVAFLPAEDQVTAKNPQQAASTTGGVALAADPPKVGQNPQPESTSATHGKARQHVLVADFLRREIHLLQYSKTGLEPRCKMPTPNLPDNLHWAESNTTGDQKNYRLLVGTFGGLSDSFGYFLHLGSKVPAAVWEVNLNSLIARLDRGEAPPADCGIGGAHWQLLLTDPDSKHLAGASAAIEVDDLLVIGQLRRPKLLVCPRQVASASTPRAVSSTSPVP